MPRLFIPHMAGRNGGYHIADIYGISKDVREERIRKYADAFELTGALGSPIGGYSHGMKQKLAVISALIRAPRLLILDEPFVGLDPQAAFVLKGFLREICAAGGAVFSLHARTGGSGKAVRPHCHYKRRPTGENGHHGVRCWR